MKLYPSVFVRLDNLRSLFFTRMGIGFFLLFSPQLSQATQNTSPPLDILVLGDTASETVHSVEGVSSEIVHGALDQTARQLAGGGAVPWESKSLIFKMKVDTRQQTYLTIKLWGGDKGQEHGRLILFVNGLQCGFRNQGDLDVLNQCDEEAEAPGRFFYQTLPLPPQLTNGKTEITCKLIALGPIWVYGGSFDKAQKTFTGTSRALYRIYTHTDGCFTPPADEVQGKWIPAPVRTTPGEEVLAQSKQIVMERLSELLKNTAKPSKPDLNLVRLLGYAYKTPWTPTFKNFKTLDRIELVGDSIAAEVNSKPNSALLTSWPGTGPLGEAIVLTWPDLHSRLDAAPERKLAWGNALHASVRYWIQHRRSFTNQSMIVDYYIYTANRALELMAPDKAIPESRALDLLYQAVGIKPWLGSDLLPNAKCDADLPESAGSAPYGFDYFLVTPKGLSRELGYVCGYGETILRFMSDMVAFTGDEKIRKQLLKIEHARFYFRYPGVDGEGFSCMKPTSEIDTRGAHYPMTGSAYNALQDRENWWMDIPAILADDPLTLGVAQQGIREGQYFAYIKERLKDPDTLGMMLNVDAYARVKQLPASKARLPMTEGQPNFVFSDETDAVLALKHGNDLLFINFYYRAERAVNRLSRVFEIRPNYTRISTVRPNVIINESGETYERPDYIDRMRDRGLLPPGQEIHQAWQGEKLPIAKRPQGVMHPAYGDWGPFVGKASFYWLQYDHYLIGLNTTKDQTFTLPTPSGVKQAPDLVSGKVLSFAGGIQVGPSSTVVLDLP